MVSAFIADGQYEQGFIKEVEDGWPDIRFTYRPILKGERFALELELAKKPEIYIEKLAKVISERIKEWNLGDKVTPKILSKLKIGVFDRLTNIILGDRITDHDPLWDDETKAEHETLMEAAADSGKRPGDIAAEKREGN